MVFKEYRFFLRGLLIETNESCLIFHDLRTIKDYLLGGPGPYNEFQFDNFPKPNETFEEKIKKNFCLFPNECLNPGEALLSPRNLHTLSFLSNGDLEVISITCNFINFSSKTMRKFASKFCLKQNGELVVLNTRNESVWSSETLVVKDKKDLLRACMQDSGVFEIEVNDKIIYGLGSANEC